MIRQVRLEITEAAVSQLHVTYLDHTDSTSTARPRGRVLTNSTALGAYDSGSVKRQGCFLRMISIVEAYVDIVTSGLFRNRTYGADELVRRLVKNAELRASTTWQERKAALNDYHQIRVSEFAQWSALDAGIEVRNAIAHGLGYLTPRQRESRAAAKISQIGIQVSNGNVVVSDENLRRCRDLCIEFIRYLDDRYQEQTPSHRN